MYELDDMSTCVIVRRLQLNCPRYQYPLVAAIPLNHIIVMWRHNKLKILIGSTRRNRQRTFERCNQKNVNSPINDMTLKWHLSVDSDLTFIVAFSNLPIFVTQTQCSWFYWFIIICIFVQRNQKYLSIHAIYYNILLKLKRLWPKAKPVLFLLRINFSSIILLHCMFLCTCFIQFMAPY